LRRFSLPTAILFLIGALFIAGAYGWVSPVLSQEGTPTPTATPSASPGPTPTAALAPAEEDTCLHCHLTGGVHTTWLPTFRWLAFGVAAGLFAFGIYRMGSLWRLRRVWEPINHRIMAWLEVRYQIQEPLEKFLRKPVPKYATRWMYCFGGITFLFLVIQAITGVMLAFYYKPSPDQAYESILFIMNEVPFGKIVRSIHFWAANGTIVMCFVHMFRVFITRAYRPPRELNWVAGAFLLVMALAFSFTGYLLPWDQRAYWATTVGTEIAAAIPIIGEGAMLFLRGGWDVTANTLSRFYSFHVLVMPAAGGLLLLLHFLMIRRQGISKPL
jgi:hypothetical protein